MEAYMKNVILYSLLSLVATANLGYSQKEKVNESKPEVNKAAEDSCINLANNELTRNARGKKFATNVTAGVIAGSVVAGPVGTVIGGAVAGAVSLSQARDGKMMRELLHQLAVDGLEAETRELSHLKKRLEEYARFKNDLRINKKSREELRNIIDVVTKTESIKIALKQLDKSPIHGKLYDESEVKAKTDAIGKGTNFKDKVVKSAKKTKIVLSAGWPQLFSRASKNENVLCRFGMGGLLYSGTHRVVKAIYNEIMEGKQ
jgi:hypothetical protein